MEFRKMVTITLCTRQQKRHWCIEQSYGLCGSGWEDLGNKKEKKKKKKKELGFVQKSKKKKLNW